jgi:phytanoyl-CoA hydroxylase
LLSSDQVKQYKSEGYCVYHDFLSESEAIDLTNEIERICAGATAAEHDASRLEMEPNQGPSGTKVRRVYEPCTYYDVFRDFSEGPKLLDSLELLLGPDVLYTSSKINIKPAEIGSVVEWHQDMAYGPVTNSSNLAALLYLDDADLQNGCLQVIPGQTRMLNHSRDGFFQGRIAEPLDTSKAVPIEGKKGTIVLFNGLAPHASSPNRSARPRRTLILGYRAADAFPIYRGEITVSGEQFVRLVRGERTNVARFDMERLFVPHYPKETKSLYELQELSRQQHATQPV